MREKITFNGVGLETHRYEYKGKKFYEIYTDNPKTKLFITESTKSGKTLHMSVFIDGYRFQLSEKYDYGMGLHIFTDLVNKFSNTQNK